MRMWCVTCGTDRDFVVIECADHPGVECPERACTDCGAAILLAG